MESHDKKKSNSKVIKVVAIVLLALLILAAAIFGIVYKLNYISAEDREQAMITAGEEFYESYMSSVTGVNEAKVTLEMLQNAVEKYDKDYDLSLLKKCESDTEVLFVIDDGKITDQKVELNCN